MPALTRSEAEQKLEAKEASDARKRAQEKARKLQMQGFLYGGLLGVGEGLAESMGLTFVKEGIGPIKFEYLQAGAGIYMATKKTGDARELGQSLATIGLFKIGKGMASGFDLGDFLGGGGE